MVNSATTLGDRLRLARAATGKSTREVAGELKQHNLVTTHVTIGNYERDRCQPDAAMLQALAAVYKRSVASFLSPKPTLSGVYYRCLKSVPMGEKSRYEARGQAWLAGYMNVEELLKRSLTNTHTTFRVAHDWDGAQLAAAIRTLYNFDIYPIPSAVKLVENFGIRVIQLGTDAKIDAFAGWLGDARVVVVNSSLPNDRIRLTVLHELAHHLYEDCIEGGRLGPDEVEQRAFEFASHALIPQSQLADAFSTKSMVTLVTYKERFGISLAAMIFRAHKSGLISRRLYQRIWIDFGRLGFKNKEPGSVPADRPVRMEALMDAAVGDKLTTYEQIAEWVGVEASEVTGRIAEAMGGTLEAPDDGRSGGLRFRNYL